MEELETNLQIQKDPFYFLSLITCKLLIIPFPVSFQLVSSQFLPNVIFVSKIRWNCEKTSIEHFLRKLEENRREFVDFQCLLSSFHIALITNPVSSEFIASFFPIALIPSQHLAFLVFFQLLHVHSLSTFPSRSILSCSLVPFSHFLRRTIGRNWWILVE